MFKLCLFVVVVLIAVATPVTAQIDPNSGLDIPWRPELPINNETFGNATKAAAENRYFLPNGTAGDVMPSNMTLNGTNATNANISNPLGCDLRVPDKFTVDPFVGEWCYFNGKIGFMFRGVRDPAGKLFLQRFRLKTLKTPPVNTTNGTNSTNGTNASIPTNQTGVPVPGGAANATSAVKAMLEMDSTAREINSVAARYHALDSQAEQDMESDAEVTASEADLSEYLLDSSFSVPESVFMELDALVTASPVKKSSKPPVAPVGGKFGDKKVGKAPGSPPGAPPTTGIKPTDTSLPVRPQVDKDPKFAPPPPPKAPSHSLPPIPTILSEEAARAEAETETQAETETEPQAEAEAETETEAKALVETEAEAGTNPSATIVAPAAPVYLPEIPTRVFGKCAAQAAEYVDCVGGALINTLNGTEARGFCADGQSSAVHLLDIRDFTAKLEVFRRQLRKFAASSFNVAPTKNITNKFNAEEDHVRLCFLPGTYVEKMRYRVKGQFESTKLGESYGFFKPTINIDCSSTYCRKNKIIEPNAPTNTFLNLQP